MTSGDPGGQRRYAGVMISSTFQDLKGHRAALIDAVERHGMHAVAMEQDAALPVGTVLDASLRKVRDAEAYIGVVSRRYGQVPECDANPDRLSLTELEFREARRLDRPTLIFIMASDHPVTEADIELDPVARESLEAFREEVKQARADAPAQRVYCEFHDLAGFEKAALQSVAELRRHLDAIDALAPSAQDVPGDAEDHDEGIPIPPRLYAEPAYIGSHDFVGRAAQLTTLDDWASPADPHAVLLFEAIGGVGKSMLTWEWTTRYAAGVRSDWAGMFWYSFYEKGAVMADFCRRALAYMTRRPLDELVKKKQPELSELLLRQLQDRPWLVVLDGLERVLVAYHRSDAAQLRDEEAGRSDEIAQRDPCDAIRPLDDDLLRALAGATPSKVLTTSRLVPRVLLNSAGQPIPGVVHERLPGLRPPDAEQLLRTCGVHGDAQTMRRYLQRHCDCHPLVTGIVAGLVTHYLPARGDFDAWASDPDHGGRLDVGALDLVQKRNHILDTALAALPDPGRELLSTLALLSDAVDYETLVEFNPHRPEESFMWGFSDDEERAAAGRCLADTVADLEKRSLLQYDHQARRYDLHPVVRAVCATGLRDEDRDHLGQRVVDYFSTRPHDPYEQADTLEDLHPGLTVVRTLQRMGRMTEACAAYRGALSAALLFNLEAYAEVLSLVRPFFAHSWHAPSAELDESDRAYLMNETGLALASLAELEQALALYESALEIDLEHRDWNVLSVGLRNISTLLWDQNRLASAYRVTDLGLEIAELTANAKDLFLCRLVRFSILIVFGRDAEAEEIWRAFDDMDRDWDRSAYRPGGLEECYAAWCLRRGQLTEDVLRSAERVARAGRNRRTLRGLHSLRGHWRLVEGDPSGAADSFAEGVRLTRESGIVSAGLETWLAIARHRLGTLPDVRDEAERLTRLRDPAHLPLARLWQEIGETERASEHASAAHRWAWADGEPYVHRYELEQATELLGELGVDVPELGPYDPAVDPPRPWERRLAAAIAELREEQAPGPEES